EDEEETKKVVKPAEKPVKPTEKIQVNGTSKPTKNIKEDVRFDLSLLYPCPKVFFGVQNLICYSNRSPSRVPKTLTLPLRSTVTRNPTPRATAGVRVRARR